MNLQIPDGFQLAHIEIAFRDPETQEIDTDTVPAICKDGILAIHSNNLGEHGFFNVTHVPTGTSLVTDVIYPHALAVIRDFENALPFSEPIWQGTRALEHRNSLKALRSIITPVIHKHH